MGFDKTYELNSRNGHPLMLKTVQRIEFCNSLYVKKIFEMYVFVLLQQIQYAFIYIFENLPLMTDENLCKIKPLNLEPPKSYVIYLAVDFCNTIDNNRHRCYTALTFIQPACNSRQTQREMNHHLAQCASFLAWCYLAGRSPTQLIIDLF